MSEAAKGIIAIISAAMIWGLAPLYYKMLDQVPPVELLGHRTFWSLIFFTIVLWLNGRLGELRTAIFVAKEGIAIFVASLLVATNWFLFIYSIQTGQATEASLGYFILPLVSVFLGLLIFKERLSQGQVFSIGLAGCAVLILTYGLGTAPWIAMTLSTTFGIYTVLKKRLKTRPMASVTLEVLFLSPFALAIFAFYHAKMGGQFGSNLEISLLLVLSGPLTATPLILFSYATHRATMATVGVLQYINPSLQFLCATLIFAEPLSIWHAVAFPLIWMALLCYTVASFYSRRSSR